MSSQSDEPENQNESALADDDKWRLRKRISARLEGVSISTSDLPRDPDLSKRLERLFQPKEQISRQSKMSDKKSLLSKFGMGIQKSKFKKSRTDLSTDVTKENINRRFRSRDDSIDRTSQSKKRIRKLLWALIHILDPRLSDILIAPIAATFFILPLAFLAAFQLVLSDRDLTIVLVANTLVSAVFFGTRFGVIGSVSTYLWIITDVYKSNLELEPFELIAQITIDLVVVSTFVLISGFIGAVSSNIQDQFKLGRLGLAREADLDNFQRRLLRAHQIEAIYAFLIAYCRNTLSKNCVFLALDEGEVTPESATALDIAAQLKSTGYARVVVNRKSYVPRALKSFKATGLAAYPLETPSGIIGILGIDVSRDGKISPLDDRYLRLLLFSAAYAIELIRFKRQLSLIEERDLDEDARQGAIASLVNNLSTTTDNITHTIADVRDILNHNPDHHLDLKVNTLERHIGALRNSIALFREVANRRD